MDSKTARGITNLGLIIGTLLILLAILILFVNFRIEANRNFFGNVTSVSWVFPNMPYSVGIAVVGIVSIAVGSAFHIKAKPQIQQPRFSKNSLYCPYCGTLNIADAAFCTKCGKKLT